jgi:hypothetical protein
VSDGSDHHDKLRPESAKGPLGDVIASLRTLRATARALLVLQRAAIIAATLLLAAALGGALDYVLRTPAPIRIGVWLFAMASVVYWFRRLVVPAAHFRPSLTDLALRVERQHAERKYDGKSSATPGSSPLAVSVGLSQSAPADTSDNAVAASLDLAARRLVEAGLTPPQIARSIRWAPAARAAAAFALVCAACLLAAASSPKLFAIGLTRTLLPWAHAPWPKRTAVVDVTALQAHPVGSSIPIRAAVTHTDRPEGRTDVWAVFRTIRGFEPGPSRRVLLTPQSRRVLVGDLSPEVRDGELFERLIDPELSSPHPGESMTLEYWLETADDRTDSATIALVEPPAVLAVKASITPPPYAAASGERFNAGDHDMGPGTDDRAQLGPVLSGSRVSLDIALNKPVVGTPAMLGIDIPGAELSLKGDRWTVVFDAAASTRIPLAITDEFGISATSEPVFTIDIQQDQPPTTVVTAPPHDESILARATIAVEGEARDDVGLASLVLRSRHAVPPKGSVGAPPEPSADYTSIAELAPEPASDPRRAVVSGSIDLSTQDLKPGDELWISTLAADAFAQAAANNETKTHAPVESAIRKLKIIDEGQFVDQILAELGGVRQSAQRLDDDQKRLMQATADRAASAQNQRAQEQIGDRAVPLREALARTAARLTRNNLNDPSLAGIVRDASAIAASAKERAADAQAAQQRAAGKDDAESIEAVRSAQQKVRDELARLTDLLERGRDSYAARRNIESILNDQAALAEETAEAGQQSAGKPLEQLDAPQRDQLRSLAEQQRQLAKRTEEALDDLASRAKRLKETDPTQADALQSAAQRGRSSRVASQQQQASQQIDQNRTQIAQDAQQEAIKSLEGMINDLDQGQKRRDQSLRRMLADVVQEIERLAREQDAQIAALAASLAAAAPAGELAPLAQPLIKLNQDTVGLSSRVRTAFKELEAVNEPLLAAARAQGTAAAALRAAPADAPKADANQRVSLARLNDALELAKKLQEQADERDQEQRRDELRQAYRQALEQQVIIKDQTSPLVGKELSRRDRLAARELGERQEALRAQIALVREQTSDIASSGLFELAHTRFEDATRAAAKSLSESVADAAVARKQDSAVRVLRSLVDALTQPPEKDEDFRDMEAGGGGQGGGDGQQPPEGLIPPFAELRLLRLVQEELVQRTRAQGDAEAPDAAELQDLGKLQDEIFRQGQALIEKLKQNNQPEGPGPNPAPASPNPEAPHERTTILHSSIWLRRVRCRTAGRVSCPRPDPARASPAASPATERASRPRLPAGNPEPGPCASRDGRQAR